MIDVARYLRRLGLIDAPSSDLAGLTTLMRAHLRAVPFENVDVFDGVPVRVDLEHSIAKVVDRGRGGWCFELNGAFAALLTALGFDVRMLGAAVLLSGPNALVDHLTLEVQLNVPYLVDVGFGDAFVAPLELNRAGPQDEPAGRFEFLPSSQGTTLTRHDSDGVPEPLYRFKRTSHQLADFNGASERLQNDKSLHWHSKIMATRLLDEGADRVTLTGTTLKRTTDGDSDVREIDSESLDAILETEFGIIR